LIAFKTFAAREDSVLRSSSVSEAESIFPFHQKWDSTPETRLPQATNFFLRRERSSFTPSPFEGTVDKTVQ
jgi:hypothetical protein